MSDLNDDLDSYGDDINELERKMNQMQELFCETVYFEVKRGGKTVIEEDIMEALEYFSKREDFEKCIILKKSLKVNE